MSRTAPNTEGEQHPPAPAPLDVHDALPLLLQHSSVTQHPRTVCALMCTSSHMRLSVAQQCRAQLPLEFACSRDAAGAQRFAAWLARWAGLARSLDLAWNHLPLQEVEAALADALRQAAAAGEAEAAAAAAAAPAGAGAGGGDCWGGPCQLRAAKANVAGPLLLEQLPPRTLTSLELGHVVDYYGEPGAAAAALRKLTGLQSLTVLTPKSHTLLPAADALTALTHACLLVKDLAANAPALRHLPPQLRTLELTVAWGVFAQAGGGSGSSNNGRPPLQLGHITGLQELRSSGYFTLQASDELPPNLVSLQAPDCPAAKPLLQLTALRTLNMYNCTAPAAELRLLGRSLTQLSEISLGYFGSEAPPDVDAAAPGWPGLPLRSLDFDSNAGECLVGAVALDALGRLGSCLTQLALSGGILLATDCAGLASTLARLTQLHTLRLAGVELLHEEAPSLSHQPGADSAPPSPPQQQQQQRRRERGREQGEEEEEEGAAPGAGPSRAAAAPAGPAAAAAASRAAALTPAGCVMEAVAGLASLRSLKLGSLRAWLHRPAAELAPLTAARQLSCLHLVDLELSDAMVGRVVCRLPGLRELDVSDNARVGDASLTRIASSLALLRNLDVSGTGVSGYGILTLRLALPGVDVVCFQTSDEEEWL